ncbi:MAG TPA: LytTR family DNA-binding domain-containing protein [Kofleriaceae bacterium]|nr:LytTR family DNA-binding domain-containing protein [Kofleriaceae bacterium]
MIARIRALVAEDEAVSRDTLCQLLAEVDWIECVGVAGDGRDAVRQIDALEPDLVFLDVQLPELNGLGVLQEIHHQPAVVFTTAHDRYAVAAFEVQAIDYLLKPFGRRRLLQALERVRGRLASGRPRTPAAVPPGEPGPLLRLARTVRGELIPLRLDAATRFEAAGDYVEAHVRGERLLLRMSLGELEQALEGHRFWRVHRSHLVAADAVKSVREHDDERRLVVVLSDGTEIIASRAASRRLRELIA